MGKNPAFQYYPKDWRSDTVWGCSLAARGLWHEMMDRMHESEQYGYLSANGKPIPAERIAQLCGTTPQEYLKLLAELDVMGVPRRTPSGIIFCKRMVEDEKKRAKWRRQQEKSRNKNKNNNIPTADVSGLSAQCQRDLRSPSPLQNHPPYPPSGGIETFFNWAGQTVAVQMGKRRRIPNLSAYSGGRASDVVEFLIRQGFSARIVSVQ